MVAYVPRLPLVCSDLCGVWYKCGGFFPYALQLGGTVAVSPLPVTACCFAPYSLLLKRTSPVPEPVLSRLTYCTGDPVYSHTRACARCCFAPATPYSLYDALRSRAESQDARNSLCLSHTIGIEHSRRRQRHNARYHKDQGLPVCKVSGVANPPLLAADPPLSAATWPNRMKHTHTLVTAPTWCEL